MTLFDFAAGLKAACPDTYELKAPQGKREYVVWNRYGFQPMYGGNGNIVNLPKVQIDIVTASSSAQLVDDVCAALWLMELPFTCSFEGYDPEYNAYRTILQLVVI